VGGLVDNCRRNKNIKKQTNKHKQDNNTLTPFLSLYAFTLFFLHNQSIQYIPTTFCRFLLKNQNRIQCNAITRQASRKMLCFIFFFFFDSSQLEA